MKEVSVVFSVSEIQLCIFALNWATNASFHVPSNASVPLTISKSPYTTPHHIVIRTHLNKLQMK